MSHRITGRGETIRTGPTEFRMLHFFMSHPERVFTRGQLLDRVWGRSVYIEERTVDVHVRRLRKALSEHGFDRFRADRARHGLPVLPPPGLIRGRAASGGVQSDCSRIAARA